MSLRFHAWPSVGRVMSTGHGAWRTTSVATLPIAMRVNPLRPCVARAISAAGRRSANHGIVRPGPPWRTLVLAREFGACRRVASTSRRSLAASTSRFRGGSPERLHILVWPDHFGQPRLQPKSIAPRGDRRDDAVGQGRPIGAHQEPASFGRQERGPAAWADEHEWLCRSTDDLCGDAAQHCGPDAALAPGGHAQNPVGLRCGDCEEHLCWIARVDDPGFDVDDFAEQRRTIVELVPCCVFESSGHNSPAAPAPARREQRSNTPAESLARRTPTHQAAPRPSS